MGNRFEAALNAKPAVKPVPEFDAIDKYKGIKAVTYDGANIGNKKTKIFAYMGYPENCADKVPGILLVHGGGGTPFLDWVKMWNDRGYAAMAMSTEGHFPLTVEAGTVIDSGKKDELWHRGLYGIFEEEGYTDAPLKDNMQNSDKEIEQQWMYHAVFEIIAAHNVMRNDSRIDPQRIGIMGVSWGGVITSLTIGYDNRFAFAIPVYGSGFLAESMGNLGEYFRSGRNQELWLAEKNFKKANMPVLWQCKNDDIPFSLNSNSKSYMKTKVNNEYTALSIVEGMRHSHNGATTREEPYVFADSVCFGKTHIPRMFVNNNKLVIDNPDNVDIMSLRVFYITEPMTYYTDENNDHRIEQEWTFENISATDDIPDCAYEYYVEAKVKVGSKECTTTSQLTKKI